MQVARRFFGTDSDLRQDELPEIEKRNRAAREAADRARKGRRRNFRNFLKTHADLMRLAVEEIQGFSKNIDGPGSPKDAMAVKLALEKVDAFSARRDALRLPPTPAKLGDYEAEYRNYRDRYNEYSAQLENLNKQIAALCEKISLEPAEKTAKRWLQKNQSQLSDAVNKYVKAIHSRLVELKEKWNSQADTDRSLYYQRSAPIIEDLEKGTSLTTVLNLLDAAYHEQREDIAGRYDSFPTINPATCRRHRHR